MKKMARQYHTEDFFYAVLKQSVARCCQSIGWHGIHNGSIDILTDLLRSYIETLGRCCNAYANFSNRSNVGVTDVKHSFKDLNIDGKLLLSFVKNVEIDPLLPIPSLPVTRTVNYLYTGNERRILRKVLTATVDETTPEEGMSSEEKELGKYCEIEKLVAEEVEIWEKLPGYLPPQPGIKRNSDGEVHDSISMVDDDDIVCSSKFDPMCNGSKSCISQSRDVDNGSRRSSISDELFGGGFAQLPTTFRRQSTVTSPTTPNSLLPIQASPPPASFENTFSDPPEQLSLISRPPIQTDIEYIEKTGLLSPPSASSVPLCSSKLKQNFKLSIPNDDQLELSVAMPPIQLMIPVVTSFSQSFPVRSPSSLSPLTKSPSSSVVKPCKPVLEKTSALSLQPIVNPFNMDVVKTVQSHKGMQSKLEQEKSLCGRISPSEIEGALSSRPTDQISTSYPSATHTCHMSSPRSPLPLPSPSTLQSTLPSPSTSFASPHLSFPPPSHISPVVKSPQGLPPLTPSCSPSLTSPLPLESLSDIESTYAHYSPPPLQSTTTIDSPLHDLSLSSSTSVSSIADDKMKSKLGPPRHNLSSNPPPPRSLYTSPTAVIDSTHVMTSSPPVFNPPKLLSKSASQHPEIFCFSSSNSPSPSSSSISSISTTPLKLEIKSLQKVHMMASHFEEKDHVLALSQTKSPLSFQEEEDSSDSSLELVKYSVSDKKHALPSLQFPSESSSPDDSLGPLTVSIKKFSNVSLEFPDIEDSVNKPSLTTSTVIKKLKVDADSIFFQQGNKTPFKLYGDNCLEQAPAGALIVSINRNLLMNRKKDEKSISPFNTTITIPKIVLPDISINSKLLTTGRSKGKGQKRELELSEVRVQQQSPENMPQSFQVDKKLAKRTRSSQASDDGSESSDGHGLKLKLKIPKQPTSFIEISSSRNKQSKLLKRSQMQSSLVETGVGSSPVQGHSQGVPSPQSAINMENL